MRLRPVPEPTLAAQLELERAWSFRFPVPEFVRASGWWKWSGAAFWSRQVGKILESTKGIRRELVKTYGLRPESLPTDLLELRDLLARVQDDAEERAEKPVTCMGVVWS